MPTTQQWIDDTVEQHSEVFGPASYDEQYFAHIYRFADALAKGKYSSIQFISTYDQSSFTTSHEGENVIFFDVVQSQLLKNVFRLILQYEDFIPAAEVFKRSGCLYILNRDYNFSSFTYRHEIIPYSNYYLVDQETIDNYKNNVRPFNSIFELPEFSEALDNFIIGHELAHLLKRNGHLPSADSYYESIFERTLEQCCYENEPDFKDIATYYGEFDLDDAGLDKIKQDLIIRRQHYLENKTYLKEEMECDAFSFATLLDFYFEKDPKAIDTHIQFACAFFMIFSIFDLHYAMTRRFLLSERSGIDELKPGGIADMNFRKVALMDNMIAHILKRSRFLEYAGEKTFFETHNDYRHAIFQLKKSFDGLYLIPITRAIHDILKNVENLQRQLPLKSISEGHIQSLLERMIRSEGLFHQEELQKIFKEK